MSYLNHLPYLPLEIWLKIFNMKRKMEIEDHWGWRKSIEKSKGHIFDDNNRWWVGENRWAFCTNWPDLDRATFIYYDMYEDLITYQKQPDQQLDHRFKMLDQIDPSRIPLDEDFQEIY